MEVKSVDDFNKLVSGKSE